MDFEDFVKAVGHNIRRARWLKGLSQVDAAHEVLTPRLLAELERGQGNPTLYSLFAIAERLDMSVRDLVETGEEKALEVPLRDLPATKPKAGRKPKVRRLTKKPT